MRSAVCISACTHSPRLDIVSDVGGLYLVVTATVADADTGLMMNWTVCEAWRVYTLQEVNWSDQGSLAPGTCG